MKYENVNKILAIMLRNIGDTLLTAPVYELLKKRFPGAHVAALVNSGTEDTLLGNPNIDELLVFDRKVKKLRVFKKYYLEYLFMKSIREKGFDMAIDLTGGDRASILAYFGNARYRLGKDTGEESLWRRLWKKGSLYTMHSRVDNRSHTVNQHMDLLGSFFNDKRPDKRPDKCLPVSGPRVYIHVPEEVVSGVNILLNDAGVQHNDTIVHVHPASRWFFKCWKDEHMAEVLRWLLRSGVKVILSTSPDTGELDKAERILSYLNESKGLVNLSGRLSLKQLAAVSMRSDMFFGVDSAPMHIAAAVDTPVLALFGPSGAFNWGPWDNCSPSGTVQYPCANGLQHSGKHSVIQRQWKCIPCGLDGCASTKQSKCLDDITPSEAISLIEDKLDKYKK